MQLWSKQSHQGKLEGSREFGEMPRQWTEFRDEQNPESHLETRWGVEARLLPKSTGKQEAVKRPEGQGQGGVQRELGPLNGFLGDFTKGGPSRVEDWEEKCLLYLHDMADEQVAKENLQECHHV